MGHPARFGFNKVLRHIGGILYPTNIVAISGWQRLVFLLLTAVMLSLWIAAGSVDANTLFQSPQSPPLEPAAVQPAPVEQAPVEQPPAEQVPVEQPPAEQAPLEQPPAEQVPIDQQSPVEQAPLEQPASDIIPPADAQEVPAAPVEPTTEPRSRRDEAPIEAEDAPSADLVLDEAEFIDTVVVSGAYIWLCCGVSLFLLVPLFLLFVYIRGRSKMMQDGNF